MDNIDDKTIGAWLLSQSKRLDNINGADRLQNISYSGKIGRLYNLLRRSSQHEKTIIINKETLDAVCRLNGIDRQTKEVGIQTLKSMNQINKATNGDIEVLGATSATVLETTAKIFKNSEPNPDERGSIFLSELISNSPMLRNDAEQIISEKFDIEPEQSISLIDLCKTSAIIDEVGESKKEILFNGNTFRSDKSATKVFKLLEPLPEADRRRIEEAKDMLNKKGAILDIDLQEILGIELYNRVMGIGLFDRLEVSNRSESVGYITLPDTFQKYGRPFEEDPVDDAKALLASLTYGMTRSNATRGKIAFPNALLNKLISGEDVGGEYGVSAIGEDYRELEKRQVVQVTPSNRSGTRFRMKLLKPDVGALALSVIRGSSNIAQETILMDISMARSFSGPEKNRREIRQKHTFDDKRFIASAINQIRSE